MMLNLRTARGCAWRGVYLYTGSKPGAVQLGRITLDPDRGIKPSLTVAFPIGWRTVAERRQPRRVEFRFRLPTIRWTTATKGPVRLWCYKRVQWLYHKLDGRYGWFGSCRRTR